MHILRLVMMTSLASEALEITVDYRFDSSGFFNDPRRRLVMEAAASRWSAIVNQSLQPVNMTDGPILDGRFQIIHPETGRPYAMSAAVCRDSDITFQFTGREADEYLGGFALEEDEFIVFVGSRPLEPGNVLARGGAIRDGGNTNLTYDDPNSFLNRGFNVGRDSLAVLGGYASFDSDRSWNFDLTRVIGDNGGADFYSVALHEIGHMFGLNTGSATEWTGLVSGNRFLGQNAVGAYNADNGTNLNSLQLFDAMRGDYHWAEFVYESRIFPFGNPLYPGTVGISGKQELLMGHSFRPTAGLRLEVTNVDAVSLRDLGWSVIENNPPRPPELPLGIAPAGSGPFGVQINSQVGRVYTIQTSPDGVSWVDVVPSLIGDGGPVSWTEGEEGFTDAYRNTANLLGKYYRVIEKEAP